MPRIRTVLKWTVCLLLLTVVLFIVYVVLELGFFETRRIEQGRTRAGAEWKWGEAMDGGDSADAIYWAQRRIYFATKGRPSLDEVEYSYHSLALAYELAGEYEDALAVHEKFSEWPLDKGRVYYKLGRMGEAFKAFCDHALAYKERRGMTLFIGGVSFPFERALSVFSHYNQFLDFMREEWKATGNHEDYREAMELIRAN